MPVLSDPDPPLDASRRRRWPAFALLAVFLLAVGLLLVGALGTAAGVVPGLSALAGMDRARDLGVRYSDEDLRAARDKLALPAGSSLLDTVLTDAEITALVNEEAAAQRLPLREVQVRVLPGERFELSGYARLSGREVPVFAAGDVQVADGGLASSGLSAVRVGRLPVPDSFRNDLEASLLEEADRWVGGNDRFTLQGVESRAGRLRIVGVVTPLGVGQG